MPLQPRPHFFWPRSVASILVALGLWWSVFYQPSLVLLRIAAQVPLALFTGRQERNALEVDSRGDWRFSIPVNAVVRDPAKGNGPVSVDAIEFAAPPENLAPFTTGWFVFLGLAMNAPLTRANLRRTLIGFGIQTAVSGLALFAYAEINAQGIVANMSRVPSEMTLWMLKVAYHVDYLVVPYASPFLILLATNRLWWDLLINGDVPKDTPPKRP